MSGTDHLKDLLSQQQGITQELEKEYNKLKSSDIITENDTLKSELTKYKANLKEAEINLIKLSKENKNLKNSLYEQMYNEKLTILNEVNKKVDAYYSVNINGEFNRLKEFETSSKRRIESIRDTLIHYRIDSEDEIFKKLQELNGLLNWKVSEAIAELSNQTGAYSQNKEVEYKRLHEESLSEEEMKRALKKNNLESLIGLNILNKIGILFLIIGVIAVTQFTYYRLPEMYKSIFAFLGGVILLVLGEILNKKKPNVFSLGLTSGGVAVLYVAIAISYFGLNTLTMYPALLLCVIITALSFALSQRYQSQTIATFSLIGGYLPILSISANKTLVYSAMIYFIILNLLSLMIAFRKKWSITAFVGFVLNAFGTGYIMNLMLFQGRMSHNNISLGDVITVIYIIFAFLVYTLIPFLSTYFNKKKLGSFDVVQLGFNTYISAILLYIAFYRTGFVDFKGLLAIVFAGSYFALAKFAGVKLPLEKKMRDLFYITSFAFVVLAIPMQLDKMWISLGWLVEGVFLLIYGILKGERNFRKYGYIACTLCLSAFLFLDFIPRSIRYDVLFAYKYFAITFSTVIIIAVYYYKKDLVGIGVRALKYCTYINLWFFMIYMISGELSKALDQSFAESNFNKSYLISALCIILGMFLAFAIPRIKALCDTGMRIISISIYIISILWTLLLNSVSSPGLILEAPLWEAILSSMILIIVSLLSVLAMMDLIKSLVLDRKFGVEWYPLVVSIYFVVLLTQSLITQYKLEFTNFAISIIYVVLALSWIVFGFVKRYSFIRRFGLGLSFMAIAKLFLMDLSFLSEGFRIISYFAFGFTLIAISFVYQYFNKRLEIFE